MFVLFQFTDGARKRLLTSVSPITDSEKRQTISISSDEEVSVSILSCVLKLDIYDGLFIYFNDLHLKKI